MTRLENGNSVSDGLCIKCAKELGVPVDNMIGDIMNKFGISSEQLDTMEEELGEMAAEGLIPSDNDDLEEGGAPAINLPQFLWLLNTKTMMKLVLTI